MGEQSCNCGRIHYDLVFACSGASDVGAVADQAARALSRDNVAYMSCAAAIAAKVPQILERTAAADHILVIDGCDKACAKTIVESGGFPHAYLQLGTIGMEKTKTPVTEANIMRAKDAAAVNLAERKALKS